MRGISPVVADLRRSDYPQLFLCQFGGGVHGEGFSIHPEKESV
jgi:hypothetical protein